MKILFIKDKRSPSGIEGTGNYLFCLCKYFNKKKIDYLILYNDKDLFYKKLLENSIKVKYVNFRVNSPKNIFKILKIRKFLKKILDKKYFSHVSVQYAGLHSLLPENKNVKYISIFHAANDPNYKIKVFNNFNINFKEILKKLYLKYYLYNYSKANKVICVSNASKITAKNSFGVPIEKIEINRYGLIDYSNHDLINFKNEFKIKENTKVIFCAGRETIDKGVLDFCEIAKSLFNLNWRFIFLGGYNDKDFHNTIVNKYGKYVTFAGMRKDIMSFYKYADLFLFLSHRESAGQVLMESFNFGLPVVTWDIFGVNEIVRNGYNGYMCKFNDFEDVKNKVKLLLNNKNLYDKISENCKTSFYKNYTIDTSAENLLKIFTRTN